MTCLHRPVCPISQGAESFPGRRTYGSLKTVYFSKMENSPATTKLFSKGPVSPCSGCHGLLGLTEQRHQRKTTGLPGLAQHTHRGRPLGRALLGARTKEGPTLPLSEDLGVQGKVLRGSEQEAMQPLLRDPGSKHTATRTSTHSRRVSTASGEMDTG